MKTTRPHNKKAFEEKAGKKVSPPVLSLLSYNVNFGPFMDVQDDDYETMAQIIGHSSNVQLVIKAIAEADADIVCLQETNAGWAYACATRLKENYPQQHFYPSCRGYYAGGSAFLFKDSVSEFTVTANDPRVQGAYFEALILSGTFSFADSTQTLFNIINVHLRPPLSMGDDSGGVLGNLNAYFFKSGPVHMSEVSAHLKHLGTENTFVVGDFNEGGHGDGYKFLSKKGYVDAVSLCSDQTTWYWPVPVIGQIWGAYDHIFYPPEYFRPSGCTIMTAYKDVSDHIPVLATFQINGKKNEDVGASLPEVTSSSF
jgi:endonuclease/exonuclease/phosphatase family metal-dependent hydrolase